MNDTDTALAASIRRHLWGAGLFLCGLLAFLVGWAAWMSISGAVIAPGSIVVETNVKTLQHREGGIVKDILVKNGDRVEAGDLLIRLDDTVTRANLAMVSKQLDELWATEARLLAERDATEEIRFPKGLLDRADQDEVADILNGQRALITARRASLDGRVDQLQEQINQLESQAEGLRVQSQAKVDEIELIEEELSGLEILLENSFVSQNRVSAIRREKTRLTGEHGSLISDTARIGQAVSERRIQILQRQDDYRAEILQQLHEVRSEIGRLEEQRVAANDQLSRVDIRSPRDGYVHQLKIHTRGGVIAPAEPVLLIVPETDRLLIEARVSPIDIDQLYPGQTATIRLPNFDQRTTPELQADVLTVSAETSQDEVTGESFYTARLQLADGEESKLGDNVLVPGMPVQTMITTQYRTILSYMVKPIQDQIAHALREE